MGKAVFLKARDASYNEGEGYMQKCNQVRLNINTLVKRYSSIFAAVFILLAALFAFSSQVDAMMLHVSMNGDDRWSGTLSLPNKAGTDGPLASITEAKNRIRKLKQDNLFNEAVDVIIHDGVYRLSQPIVFEPQDSGTKQCPITYRAFPGSHPIFSGARTISGFKSYKGGLWTCVLPELKNASGGFEQLFAKGVRLMRAQSPNSLYYYMQSSESPSLQPQQKPGADKPKNHNTIYAAPGDMAQLLKLSQNELQDIVVTVYHSWEVSKHRIAKIDVPSNTIILNGRTFWPIQRWGIKQKYTLENYLAALDLPGEWFLDRERILYYYPTANDSINQFSVEAPSSLENLMVLKGEPEKNKLIGHITFKGLTFSYSESRLPAGGNSDAQAAVGISATIIADGCQNVSFQDCEISHIGNYAIWFRRGCNECELVRCYMHDLGAGGVKVGETGIQKDKNQLTGKIIIDNCIIRGGGRIYPGAVAVWIGQSGNNRIAHNEISDFFYTGVSAGWSWGYGTTPATNNIIEYNHIHHIGQKVLSDLGGIYTLGRSPGTIVRYNTIHDIFSYDLYGKGAWGVYNDQGSSYITIENNLIYNTQTGGYHLNGGKENTIRNNIFAFGHDSQIQNSGVEPTLSFRFINNIVIWDKGQPIVGRWKGANISLSNNIYWDISGKPIKFDGQNFQDWQTLGRDKNSVILNPSFVDVTKFNFKLNKPSLATSVGFVPFDFSKAGVYGDKAWKDLATQQGSLRQ